MPVVGDFLAAIRSKVDGAGVLKLFLAVDPSVLTPATDAVTETDSAAEPIDSEESARANWPGRISTCFLAL